MNILPHLTVSNEGIEFQNGAFFKELVLTLGHTPKESRGSMKNEDFGKLGVKLDKVINRHVGLTTDVVWEDFDMNAYVTIGFINPNSPIYVDLNAGAVAAGYEGVIGVDEFVRNKDFHFKINLKTSKVSGSLANEKFRIGLPKLTYINGKLDDEELAGMLLHELGHLFAMFECLDKTVSTNSILLELEQRLRNNPTPKEREVTLKKAGKILGFESKVVEDAVKSTDDKAVLTVYVGQALERIRTQSGNQFFDRNTWETLSDQFAIRHGAGKALATGLEKMDRSDSLTKSAVSYGNTSKYLMLEIFKVVRIPLVLGGSLVGAGGLVATAVTLSVPLLIMTGLSLLISGAFYKSYDSIDDSNNEATPTYGTAFERVTRMRQQLIEQAKRLTLTTYPVVMQQQLLQDVAAIDEVLKNYHDRRAWFDVMAAFFFSPVRNQQTNVKFQKQLEALALNDLYLHSLSLKNI